MEQKPYTFKPFRKWFAAIEPRKLTAGDYSMAGLEDRVAVELSEGLTLSSDFAITASHHCLEAIEGDAV